MHLDLFQQKKKFFLSSLTWSGLQIKELLEYKNLKHFPPYSGSMLLLARNDNGKGMRATVCPQASKTIEPCPEEKLRG